MEVPNRQRDTLWPIIQRHIHPGSRIVTDCFSVYVTDPEGPNEHSHIEDIQVNPPYTHEWVRIGNFYFFLLDFSNHISLYYSKK